MIDYSMFIVDALCMIRRVCRYRHLSLLTALVAALCPASGAAADAETVVTSVIRRLPRTAEEVDALHQKSEFACLQLPAEKPLVDRRFDQRVLYNVAVMEDGVRRTRKLPFDWGRWPVLTFGTRMTEEDQADLPVLTGGAILERIDNSYISVQVRVHRQAPDGAPYLHYVPIAGVGQYGQPQSTQEFASLQQAAVNDVRGLGLLVKPGEKLSPEVLRTLVISNKGSLIVPNDGGDELRLRPSLELMFVRLRVARGAAPATAADLSFHAFATSDGMRKLQYFAPVVIPQSPDDCSIRSTVRITEYALAGQYPSARAARHLRFRTRAQFALADLDKFAAAKGLAGGALDNLTDILDAIIDGRVP